MCTSFYALARRVDAVLVVNALQWLRVSLYGPSEPEEPRRRQSPSTETSPTYACLFRRGHLGQNDLVEHCYAGGLVGAAVALTAPVFCKKDLFPQQESAKCN